MQESQDGRESPDQHDWKMKSRTKCQRYSLDGAVELQRH
jgi:hypothetical protein